MLSIGQLAKQANVSSRTLRYYEELGLIVPKLRGENRYRYYDESHLQRLNTIKMLQESGFALKEIVAALAPILEPHTQATYLGQEMAKKIFAALSAQRSRLLERQKEISQTIDELQNMMSALHDCFGCKASASIEDCANCRKGPSEVTQIGERLKNDHLAQDAKLFVVKG